VDAPTLFRLFSHLFYRLYELWRHGTGGNPFKPNNFPPSQKWERIGPRNPLTVSYFVHYAAGNRTCVSWITIYSPCSLSRVKNCSICRRQVPMCPAFCLTEYVKKMTIPSEAVIHIAKSVLSTYSQLSRIQPLGRLALSIDINIIHF
jgi:hypothetical protein